MSDLKIYFAAPIRGVVEDKQKYITLIHKLQEQGEVLTEHLWTQHDKDHNLSEEEIFQRDIRWILSADIVVAEVSTPSLGVGLEAGVAWAAGKPFIGLYRNGSTHSLSAMIGGNSVFRIVFYDQIEELQYRLESLETLLVELRAEQAELLEGELESFMNDYERDVNSHEIERILRHCDPYATVIFTEQSLSGHEEIAAGYRETWNTIQEEIFSINDVQWVTLSPLHAVCVYEWSYDGIVSNKKESGRGKGSMVLSKTSGSWKISHLHMHEW